MCLGLLAKVVPCPCSEEAEDAPSACGYSVSSRINKGPNGLRESPANRKLERAAPKVTTLQAGVFAMGADGMTQSFLWTDPDHHHAMPAEVTRAGRVW